MTRFPFIVSVLYSFVCLSSSISVSAYAPLGSEPVERCEIHSYECPSHYICVSDDSDNYGRCICDRLYGFYGPTCEKLSVASYLFAGVCITCCVLMGRALFLNLSFAHSLHRTGSLQQNALCRCLFFNTFMVFPIIMLAVGFFMGLFSIDKKMIFNQFVLYPVYTCMILTFVLSTMSISLAWIETVEKTRRRDRHWRYKFLFYGKLVVTVLMSAISFRFSLFSFVLVFEAMSVSFSYFQAKRMVTEALSVMEENGDIVVFQGASDVLHTIKQTSKKMILYSLFFSLSCILTVLTTTLKRPMYEEQNNLPRYMQGQVGFLLAILSLYKINMTLLEYLKYSAKRQLSRTPLDRSYAQSMKAFCSCLCCWSSCCKDNGGMDTHQHVELVDIIESFEATNDNPISDAPLFVNESSTQNTRGNRSQNKRKQNEKTIQTNGRSNPPIKQQLDLSKSTSLRRLLSSLFSPSQEAKSNSADSHMSSLTPFALVTVDLDDYQSQARLVADTGGGRLADYVLKPEDVINGASSGTTDSCQLVAGSHAFVKCYGEPFIRCCLDSFRFGCAVGHESLTRHSEVLLAGEVEVNEAGTVTRWLNKSGLHIPPQWVLSQSGLPFELAWLYLSEHEVSAIEPHRRDALQSSGALVNLLDSTDDIEDQSGEDCRCASCVKIRHGAADSTVNQPKDQPDVETEDHGDAAGPLVVCERRKRFRGLGALGLDGQSSISCSWVLKASADIGNSWQLPMGTSAYVHTKEAVARVRHMMGGSLVEKSHTVVPSDMLYNSSSSPISELTDASDADDSARFLKFAIPTNENAVLKCSTKPDLPVNGSRVDARQRNAFVLYGDENSNDSDVSSLTTLCTPLPHQNMPTAFIGKSSGEAVELENEAIVVGLRYMADEHPGCFKSDVFLGSKASSSRGMTPPGVPPIINGSASSMMNLPSEPSSPPPRLMTVINHHQQHSANDDDVDN